MWLLGSQNVHSGAVSMWLTEGSSIGIVEAPQPLLSQAPCPGPARPAPISQTGWVSPGRPRLAGGLGRTREFRGPARFSISPTSIGSPCLCFEELLGFPDEEAVFLTLYASSDCAGAPVVARASSAADEGFSLWTMGVPPRGGPFPRGSQPCLLRLGGQVLSQRAAGEA